MPKIPRSPKGLATEIYVTRTRRLALQKEAEKLKSWETQLLDAANDRLEASETARFDSEYGSLVRSRVPIVTVNDFGKVLAYAVKHKCPQIVHQRVSPTQIEALFFEQKTVPGLVLEHLDQTKFNLKKKATAPKGKK